LPASSLSACQRGQQPGLDHQIGQAVSIIQHRFAVRGGRLVEKRLHPRLIDQAAASDQIKQLVGGHLGHASLVHVVEHSTPDRPMDHRPAVMTFENALFAESRQKSTKRRAYCLFHSPEPVTPDPFYPERG